MLKRGFKKAKPEGFEEEPQVKLKAASPAPTKPTPGKMSIPEPRTPVIKKDPNRSTGVTRKPVIKQDPVRRTSPLLRNKNESEEEMLKRREAVKRRLQSKVK